MWQEGGELVQKDLEALRMNTSHIIFFAKGHTCQENLIVSTLVSRGRKIFFIIPQVSYGERERGEERERGGERERIYVHGSPMILGGLINKNIFLSGKPALFKHEGRGPQ